MLTVLTNDIFTPGTVVWRPVLWNPPTVAALSPERSQREDWMFRGAAAGSRLCEPELRLKQGSGLAMFAPGDRDVESFQWIALRVVRKFPSSVYCTFLEGDFAAYVEFRRAVRVMLNSLDPKTPLERMVEKLREIPCHLPEVAKRAFVRQVAPGEYEVIRDT